MLNLRLRRRVAACGAAVSVVLAAVPAPTLAVAPVDGGPINLFPVSINEGAGDQYDPHIDGDLVSYTSDNTIRYYDFVTGDDIQVPSAVDTADQLSDVSAGRIAFARLDFNSGDIEIQLFDTATSTTVHVAPLPGTLRSTPGFGGDTIAFIDGTAAPSDLYAARLGGAVTQVTSDARIDQRPQVSPDGDLVVYESCATVGSNCDVHKAVWSGGTWSVGAVTSTAEPESQPDTDGTVIVYDAIRSGERHVRWQPAAGGAEQLLDLPGQQRNPSVRAGLIVFESIAVGEVAADLFAYQLSTNRLFRITTTPWNETLNDVSVRSDGMVRLVWSSGGVGDRDVLGATFEVPPAGPTYAFGGFLAPVEARPTLNSLKAGAAVPVKFSLGGDRGLAIFAAGSPRSQTIACDSAADVDAIEETVTAGSSGLAYDPVADQYTYVWKTDKAWRGSCRQLVLAFADGSTQRANFTFR